MSSLYWPSEWGFNQSVICQTPWTLFLHSKKALSLATPINKLFWTSSKQRILWSAWLQFWCPEISHTFLAKHKYTCQFVFGSSMRFCPGEGWQWWRSFMTQHTVFLRQYIYMPKVLPFHTKKIKIKKNGGTLGATEQYTTKTCVRYNRKLQRKNTRCRINIKKIQ